MALRVYQDMMSQPCRALIMFLKLNQIPYQDCPVALRKGEHLTDKFAAIHPVQRVPVIDHDGYVLSESVAIFQYLCASKHFVVAPNWLPEEPHLRARILEYTNWQHLHLRAFSRMYFQTRIMKPRRTGKPFDPKELHQWGSELEICLNRLKSYFLRDPKWKFISASPDISIADLFAVCELEQPICAGSSLRKDHSRIDEYMIGIRDRVGPQLYDDTHHVCRKVRAALDSGKL